MQIIYRNPTVSEYNKLRSTTNWGATDTEATQAALHNSVFSVLAVENNEVIGMGRIIGDGGLYFYIQDVIVHPEFRNKGIGKTMMFELLGYIRENSKQGTFIGLMAAKGVKDFYQPFGFKQRDTDAPGMYLIIK